MELFFSPLLRESPGENARASSTAHRHGLGPIDKAPAVSPTQELHHPCRCQCRVGGKGCFAVAKNVRLLPTDFLKGLEAHVCAPRATVVAMGCQSLLCWR